MDNADIVVKITQIYELFFKFFKLSQKGKKLKDFIEIKLY